MAPNVLASGCRVQIEKNLKTCDGKALAARLKITKRTFEAKGKVQMKQTSLKIFVTALAIAAGFGVAEAQDRNQARGPIDFSTLDVDGSGEIEFGASIQSA